MTTCGKLQPYYWEPLPLSFLLLSSPLLELHSRLHLYPGQRVRQKMFYSSWATGSMSNHSEQV